MYNNIGLLYGKVAIVKDNSIKAVYDADLEALLKSLGVIDEIQAGKYRCVFCDQVISLDNIDGIIPLNNEIAFSCNAPTCRIKMIEGMNKK